MRDITVHKCDVCDREIQLPRKRRGIETVGKCIITQNCRGKLYVKELIQTTSPFLKPTEDVVGLDNFYPRQKLFNFSQRFEKSTWYIQHNLETFPIVSVYDDQKEIVPDTNFKTRLIDKNTVELIFNNPISGTAQLYVREVAINEIDPRGSARIVEKTQVSTALLTGTIAFATTTRRVSSADSNGVDDPVSLELTSPTGQIEYAILNMTSSNPNSPWSGVREIVVRNKTYYVGIADFFSSGYNTSIISNGTTIKIRTAQTGDQLNISHILLADEPFDRVDINRSQILTRSAVNNTTNSLFFDNDQIFCNNAAISRVFPELIVK